MNNQGSAYDQLVLTDHPVLYIGATAADLSGKGHAVTAHGSPAATATMPNGDEAFVFNGVDQYLEVADTDDLSPPQTGVLTIEALMRPDVLTFSHYEGSGYVHWMGKGEPEKYEYVSRMYNFENSESRPNRISGYAFNPSGGKGVGSYFQKKVTVGEWIHYTLVINLAARSKEYPLGYTKLYRNGSPCKQGNLASLGIEPKNGSAPFRVGTRDFGSFFQGAIAKIAIYDYELTEQQIFGHSSAMVPPVVAAETR